MKTVLFLVILLAALATFHTSNAAEERLEVDECLRRARFDICASMPQGEKPDPQQLEKCERQARMDSLMPPDAIPKACKAEREPK
jgi:hypothetical protein